MYPAEAESQCPGQMWGGAGLRCPALLVAILLVPSPCLYLVLVAVLVCGQLGVLPPGSRPLLWYPTPGGTVRREPMAAIFDCRCKSVRAYQAAIPIAQDTALSASQFFSHVLHRNDIERSSCPLLKNSSLSRSQRQSLAAVTRPAPGLKRHPWTHKERVHFPSVFYQICLQSSIGSSLSKAAILRLLESVNKQTNKQTCPVRPVQNDLCQSLGGRRTDTKRGR